MQISTLGKYAGLFYWKYELNQQLGVGLPG